ncbi:hybrid sensor histidine kinase/response regulator transcription factor [Pedobacter sp. AW31-3R]|uniref:hybrid sensor histidine kinase/response regulator transcription factor n=1 Tax=Pedobacter sp. AW31-3R TaxID=3445781 RepID=UPI003FA0AB91
MRLTLFLILFFYTALLFGQPDKARYLSLQEGLSSQQVLDVAHDKYGFIWVATELGLNRFASNSFKQYYKSEKADGLSVNSNEINTLLYDDDQLYIGTRANGLNVLDMKTNKFSYYLHDPDDLHSLATNDITDIIKSKDGRLWLSTYHQGVQRFDPVKKRFERFNRKRIPSLPENSIWTLCEDQQGLLYIGHVNKGLSIFHPGDGKVELLDVQNTKGRLPDNEVKALFRDSKNNIWIGTRKGLAVYNPLKKNIQHISLASKAKNKVEPFVYAIKEIDGAIWVGTESSQLFILEPDYNTDRDIQRIRTIVPYELNRGNNSSVQNIDLDNFGNVWMAIYGGGIAFSGHEKPFFSIFPTPEMLPALGKLATVTAILHDRDESMWLITAGDGILQVQRDGKVIKRTTRNSGVGDDFLLSGFEDSQNNKWFGLQNGGVSIFEAKTKSWRKIDAGEKMSAVRAIFEDSQQNIWFAAEEGLFIHHPGRQTFEKTIINTPMLGDYAPRTLVEDSRGLMWVGTYGQGLYLFDRNRKLVRKISKGQGINSNTINHLFRDRRNNIWIATNEGLALQSVNKPMGELEQIVPPGSGTSLTVNAIAEDRNGNIWFSTRLGLLRYLPEEKRFLTYDHSFGLPLGGFTNNSVAADAKGRLFFGMPAGICYFEPTEIPLNLPGSPIRISRFMVFNTGETHALAEKNPNPSEEISLEHDENSFRVELAVMDYALNDMIELSYQLHGLDNDWIFLGNEKSLDFRNIPYGKYELRIRTRQKNQDWPGDYKQLFINISPPFYLSTYALALYVILVAAIVTTVLFFYIKKINAEAELRLKKLQLEQDEQLHLERLNFYTNITHELRTPLTLILGPLEDLLQEEKLSSKHKEWVTRIQKNANRLFSLVNQLLEFRKVESQHKPLVLGEGYLAELVQETVLKYVEANNRKELKITCLVEEKDIKTTFDAEIVQLILDNLLSNACKYTSSGSVDVRLSYEQDKMSTCALIYVKDTGCGIAPEHLNKIFDKFYQVPRSTGQGTGVGLALVRQLAAIHHGKISVKSELGKGSEFCVRLLTNAVVSPVKATDVNPDAESGMSSPGDQQRPLLLLVEDNRELLDYLSSLLCLKYDVIQAENGQEGFALAKSRIPDIILSDIMMPDMDGFRMLQELKQERETSHIPMIFLTAKDSERDKERGYELGVDSYLTKPISPQLLYRRIENLLLKRKAVYAEVLGQLSSQNKPAAAESATTPTELWRENAFVQEFVSLVEDCIQDEVLDATTLADKMNMSQSTLYRKLKGLTGKNINQLVRKVRIQKAAQLLRSGKYNVTEVSLMVGINSSIYFRQCFKEELGQLPSEYQKQALNKIKG